LRIGVSDPVSTLDQLSSALIVARARRITSTGDGAVIVNRSSDVRSHRELLALLGDRTLASFSDDVLGPLVEYDQRNGSDLVATLRAFLENGGAWVQTARDLDLHPNTMRYRMSRVEDLTGRDLSRMSDRVDLFLAFASLDL
jgi:DNA-binding PucR family transcriptional regulator